VNLESLEQLLLRTSAMVDAHHEIVELDLNPVIASPDGVQTVDARLRVEAVAPRRSWPRAWSP
jgi:acetyltransferase